MIQMGKKQVRKESGRKAQPKASASTMMMDALPAVGCRFVAVNCSQVPNRGWAW